MSMKKKWASSRGETMVEALCGILLTALSVALLVAMVSSAARLNRKAQERDHAMYAALSGAENAVDEAMTAGEIRIQVQDQGSSARTETFSVEFYGEEGVLIAYRAGGAGGTP